MNKKFIHLFNLTSELEKHKPNKFHSISSNITEILQTKE